MLTDVARNQFVITRQYFYLDTIAVQGLQYLVDIFKRRIKRGVGVA